MRHTHTYTRTRTHAYNIHVAQCTYSGINQSLNIPSQERNTNPLFISGVRRDYSHSIVNVPKVDHREISACNVYVP